MILQCACWRLTLLYKDSRWLVLLSGKSILKHKQKVVGSMFILRASTRPSRSAYTSRVRLMMPSSFHVTSTAGSPLPLLLHLTSLRSAEEPSSRSLWLLGGYLTNVRLAALQRTTPCLHFDLLDLHSRSSILDVTHVGGIHFFLDPRAPYTTLTMPSLRQASTWPHLGCYAYTSIGGLRDMGTHGPHRPGSQRSLSSGPGLPEAQSTWKWTRRPYPQPSRPWKTREDLIQTPEDPPGLWRKTLPQVVARHRH
jgi:hypothetical protein